MMSEEKRPSSDPMSGPSFEAEKGSGTTADVIRLLSARVEIYWQRQDLLLAVGAAPSHCPRIEIGEDRLLPYGAANY